MFKKVLTIHNYFLSEQDLYAYKLSKQERILVASVLLINTANYITLSTIAENLYVSRATIINDLDSIKSYIKEFNLEVTSHPNKGLRVDGKESDKRLFLMQVALKKDDNSMISRYISLQAGNRITIQKVLSEQERLYEYYLTDNSFEYLVTYLGIMVNRNGMGEYLEEIEKANNDKYLMALDILRLISQYCHLKTSENEIQFLSEILLKSRYIKKRHKDDMMIKIQLVTRQFIDRVSYDLGINLADDYDFFENLSNHLESILKPEAPLYPQSEIVDELLKDNEEVVEAVNSNLGIIEQYAIRELTSIETGYIAIHICALERKKNKEVAFHVILACHAGIGTSQLLIEKLKKHFNFQIVDIISAHEAPHIESNRADLIISTIPIANSKIDVVTVSPLLNDEDYLRVGNKIDSLRNSRHLPSRIGDLESSPRGLLDKISPILKAMAPEKYDGMFHEIKKVVREYFNKPLESNQEMFSPYLHHLLPSSHIQLDVECLDWQDAITKSAKPLLEAGYIEQRYIQAMIDNINENGPYIVLSPGFALPHEGLDRGSVKVGMNLIRLKNPVPFGADEFDPVEFVCCLSAIDHKTHLKAFFNLVNMLTDEKFKNELREAKTSKEAALAIEKYEYLHI
ncbi:MAG: PTS sugar transporter subunit IIA [Erysipelotrichaceae bacterium]|nr:PTS sugar transporter subunit IIA [Erysipelotrichaceae bacterium]MDD3810636.1 PTS sugar transporter subunit IIA [Erysipelotrichaceae bacterium]